MKVAKSTLAILIIGTLCCSIALAKPIRGTQTFDDIFFGLDANGNFADNSPNGQTTLKGILFPKSGILINRGFQKNTVNASGKRQVIRNAQIGMYNPAGASPESTRSRLKFPKGRARKMNLVTERIFGVHNPKKAPPEEVNFRE